MSGNSLRSSQFMRSREIQNDIPDGIIIPISLNGGQGNAIGTPGGAFGFQMGFARQLHKLQPNGHGTLKPNHRPNLDYTQPAVEIPEHANWNDPHDIVSFHAKAHRAAIENIQLLEQYKFLPTTAVTQSKFRHPGVIRRMEQGKIKADGEILLADGRYQVTDVNIDPVWRIEGVARRIGVTAEKLRAMIFAITMKDPELITREDLPYYLPPMDGPNIHIFGEVQKLADPNTVIAARSHDFCRDGDNYALRCTCAPFKEFAIEECIKTAQEGGIGIMVYYPEEGRNLGSVIKHLVYNKRANQPGGDHEGRYMGCTEEVAGGEDARMHWTKPDAYRWLLGSRGKITRWLSENPFKRNALESAGISIEQSIDLPEDEIPPEARVEIGAKRNIHGYGGNGNGNGNGHH